jgi:hypothetical protein
MGGEDPFRAALHGILLINWLPSKQCNAAVRRLWWNSLGVEGLPPWLSSNSTFNSEL